MCAGCVGGAGGLPDTGGWQARVDQCDGSRTMAERRDRPPSVAVYRPVDHDVSTVWGGEGGGVSDGEGVKTRQIFIG